MRADIIDAEIVEDFNVDAVFKPQAVHEVEVYTGPDDTAARTNLRQAGEIEKSAQWAKARLIACSVRAAGRGRPVIDSQESIKVSALHRYPQERFWPMGVSLRQVVIRPADTATLPLHPDSLAVIGEAAQDSDHALRW